jgi:hypothetical protein
MIEQTVIIISSLRIIDCKPTTLSNILLSSLTAYAAELVLNQEYGFGRNLCKDARAVFHMYVLFHVIV